MSAGRGVVVWAGRLTGGRFFGEDDEIKTFSTNARQRLLFEVLVIGA